MNTTTFITKALLLLPLAAMTLSSCSDNGGEGIDDDPLSDKEAALKSATVAYVDHTVLPTYRDMADAAIELYGLCATIQSRWAEGALTSADIAAAGEAWKRSRKSWELSEAFLFGPASQHNIDPHIDSWPLDKAAMDDLLADIRAGKSWSIDNNGGYGLLGFHSIEYMLFELSADQNTSLTHSTDYTAEELQYLLAVAQDLRDQCVLLEACWAGDDNISDVKRTILSEADLGFGEAYGSEMKNARQAGSRFKTYQAAAEEIIQGCIDIADEVGNTKIGRPNSAASLEDKNYIESPYSLNSIEDFIDNIRSIENSYFGSLDGDASLSDYVKSVDAALDAEVRQAIDAAIAAIALIPEPFAKHATDQAASNAVTVVGTDLVNTLQKVSRCIEQ
ncbi:MAG: imelysin family protein [Muribaculaceae bacterium]